MDFYLGYQMASQQCFSGDENPACTTHQENDNKENAANNKE